MRRAMRAASALAASAVTLAGCDPGSALLIVEVTGRPTSVQSLRLTARLNNKQAMPAANVVSSLDNFGLLLPPEPRGLFQLDADGLDDRSCVLAQGHTDTTLVGQDRVKLTLPLTTIKLPVCSP